MGKSKLNKSLILCLESFENVAMIVAARLKEIGRDKVVRLWAKGLLHLFEYLDFKEL